MKKSIVAVIIAILFIGGFRLVLGFFPWHVGVAVSVATGLGAKLACSGKYVTGLSNEQIMDDLASYSPVTRLLELDYSTTNQVTATLSGLSPISAIYRPSLGCTLEIGDTADLNSLSISANERVDLPWPAGKQVNTIKNSVQTIVEDIVNKDNQDGKDTRALVVVHDGQIVAEAYGPGYDKDTALLGWSMGKSLVAMLIGRLENLQNIDETQTVLFPEWSNDARADIQLVDLLQMVSGLSFDETYAPGSDSTHMLFSAHSASDVALVSQPGRPPGEHFSYSSGTTNILARWLHNTLGGSQQTYDFLYEQLFQPAGIISMVFEPDPSGIYVGSSYIYGSGRDWARLGLIMLNQGKINGYQLLSEDWVKRAISPNNSENYKRYGYQFWLNSDGENLSHDTLPKDAYFMTGNRKQYVMIVPSSNAIIVRLGWTSGLYPSSDHFKTILDALNRE
ncbi:MAG: serine hydrolase [Pseudomonadota bacterium]